LVSTVSYIVRDPILTAVRGEPGDGNWTVVVKDTVVNKNIGTFTDWRMTLWGESIDPSKAKPYPMPTEFDDDDDEDDQPATTISAQVSTTSVAVGSTTSLPTQPTDHIERPTPNKENKPTVSATTTASSSTISSTAPAAATSSSGMFLPSIFPTFGVSPKTQVWIYGAIVAIIIFCAALGVFFCIWRKRRGRVDRADYEFEVVNNEDLDGAGEPLSGDGVRRQRRGGELYDAFAGESDEEIFSEAEEEYKDERPEDRHRGGNSRSDLSEKN
jgi:kexin